MVLSLLLLVLAKYYPGAWLDRLSKQAGGWACCDLSEIPGQAGILNNES